MKVKTTRFGELELDESRIISFTEGILGFPNYKKFVLLDRDNNSPFVWLQSVETEELAFVLMKPVHVFPDSDNADAFHGHLQKAESPATLG